MDFAKRILPLVYIQRTVLGAESVSLLILSKIPFFNKKLPLHLPGGFTSKIFIITGCTTTCCTFQPHTREKRSNNQLITDFTKSI